MGGLREERFGGSGRGGENEGYEGVENEGYGGVETGGAETGTVTKRREKNGRPVSVSASPRTSGIKRRATKTR